MNYKFTIFLQKEDDWYVAKCIENNVASQGKSIDESVINLKEALQLYYEDNDKPVENGQTFIATLRLQYNGV
jgi:predicted RNase H-like HicB family nuclease